ncbi:MAG: hypothetical protein ACP5H5_10120, partial [Pyrobaculum sp.]
VFDVGRFLPGSWSCGGSFVIPELVEVDVPSRVLLDWPLADPCPHVLAAADRDPLGLLTTETCYKCWG